MKKYTPVQIKNPTSEHHTVRLHPTQQLKVVLSKSFHENLDVEIAGHFLRLDKTEDHAHENVYVFRHITDPHWAKLSGFYIGEIKILIKGDLRSRLIVFLECSNIHKKDVITVINPRLQNIKMEPQQILEIVVSSPNFGAGDEWSWTYSNLHKNNKGLELEQIAHRARLIKHWDKGEDLLGENSVYHMTRRISEYEDPYCKEHHFWFRMNSEIIRHMETNMCEMCLLGNLLLKGMCKTYKKYCTLNVWLNIKGNSKNKTLSALTLEEFSGKHLRNVGSVGSAGPFRLSVLDKKPTYPKKKYPLVSYAKSNPLLYNEIDILPLPSTDLNENMGYSSIQEYHEDKKLFENWED